MRWPLSPLVCALILTMFAGCTATSDPPEDDPAPEAPVSQDAASLDMPGAAAHCEDAVVFFLRDPAFYQAQLPANYTTRDAKDLADAFGLPITSGRAAAYVSGYECPTSDYANGSAMAGGEVAILIHPPSLDGNGTGPDTPATLDFYLKNWHSNGTRHLALLESLDLPHTNVSVEAGFVSFGPLHEGSVAIDDAEGTLLSYTFSGTEADPYTGLVRIWHETPDGIAWADLVFNNAPNGKGVVTDCTFRPDSIYAEVLGVTDCSGDPTMTLIFYDQSYDGGFHYRAGVHATA